jgi:hypothetical protein
VALVSGVYLFGFGWVPDPLPFIDEGLALVIFLNALAYLGLDLRGLFGMGKGKKEEESSTIDID